MSLQSCLAILIWITFTSAALVAPTASGADEPANQNEEEEEPPLEPEDVELRTIDKYILLARYYPSRLGKDAVPVLIVHDWESSAADLETLALILQERGHAVLVPDLRGHGASETVNSTVVGRPPKKFDRNRFDKREMAAIVQADLEAAKTFLFLKNNEGLLNIEKLCVVGVDFGTLLAMNWAVLDWDWETLPGFKQGKDVKAMVLISPQTAARGLTMKRALDDAHVPNLSYMIVVGDKDSGASKKAKRVHGVLRRFHPDPPKGQEERLRSLFLIELDTTLQGQKLMDEEDFSVPEYVAAFIDARLVQKKFEWTLRVKP